jgi:cysteinyl-tRNA synthetase
MSKSLGNFFTLRDVFEKFDPMVIRFYMLNHQFKAPIDFAFDDIEAVQKSYQKLVRAFQDVPVLEDATREHLILSPTVAKMFEFLCDDLNTPGMWGVMFESLSEIAGDQHELMLVKSFINQVLGLTLEPLPEKVVEITPEMQTLIAAREVARQEKNWQRADELRDQLKQMGFEVQDKRL